MFDWATVWPFFTVLMKFLGVAGIIIIVVLLVAIPQIEYRRDPKNYFRIVEDYDAVAADREAAAKAAEEAKTADALS
jgi:PTS system ascorbate-specific IIC component